MYPLATKPTPNAVYHSTVYGPVFGMHVAAIHISGDSSTPTVAFGANPHLVFTGFPSSFTDRSGRNRVDTLTAGATKGTFGYNFVLEDFEVWGISDV